MRTRSLLHFIVAVAACIPSLAIAERNSLKFSTLASLQPVVEDLCSIRPRALTISYTCNGQTNPTDYEVVSGTQGVTYNSFFQTYMAPPMLVSMPRSGRVLHLGVSINEANCDSASVFALDLGIQRVGQSLLDASATSSNFGSKPYGEQLTISTGSPAGWAGCVVTVTR
jgi:hypothetical protein